MVWVSQGREVTECGGVQVNKQDVVSVFKATSKEDFRDVVKLLPENTPLPASNKMTYLIARLEANPPDDLAANLEQVISHGVPMGEAVGPAVGCLMATFGTNMISSCIFDFDDPGALVSVEERKTATLVLRL
jgi:kinesin family protein 4/21/27